LPIKIAGNYKKNIDSAINLNDPERKRSLKFTNIQNHSKIAVEGCNYSVGYVQN